MHGRAFTSLWYIDAILASESVIIIFAGNCLVAVHCQGIAWINVDLMQENYIQEWISERFELKYDIIILI